MRGTVTTPPVSAGVVLFRFKNCAIEVLLVHPGGPFWRSKDRGAWQIPKGLIEDGEDARDAALREAREELGLDLAGPLTPLGQIRQAGGKRVEAFALERDVDPAQVRSNTFELRWPPRDGWVQTFPEIDAARWFTIEEAGEMMLRSQTPLLERLRERLRSATS